MNFPLPDGRPTGPSTKNRSEDGQEAPLTTPTSQFIFFLGASGRLNRGGFQRLNERTRFHSSPIFFAAKALFSFRADKITSPPPGSAFTRRP